MKNDPSPGWLSLGVMGQKNWDGSEEIVGKTGVGGARRYIGGNCVCFTPAGESLINSGLVLYLTDSKNVKGGKKRRGEGRMAAPTRSRTCCISGRTDWEGYERREGG